MVTAGKSHVNQAVTDPVTLAYHELRGPLGLMVSAARSAAEECDDEVMRSRCMSILRTAERMLRTASQMMAVAETALEEAACTFSPVAVVDRVISDYRGLRVPIRATLPPAGLAEAFGVPRQLEALLCSVLGNALDHGNALQSVDVTVVENGNDVVIRVRNVIGCARHRGLGLGSYIGEKLATALNASLQFTRTDTEFTAQITLPAVSRMPLAMSLP